MNPVFVREAVAADGNDIERLEKLSKAESVEHRGEVLDRPIGDERRSFVAGVGDSVFGALVASCTGAGTWTIHMVHVEQSARGIGIGDALLSRVIPELQRAGARCIESGAQPGDRALKNLFERHGLVARTIILGRDL